LESYVKYISFCVLLLDRETATATLN